MAAWDGPGGEFHKDTPRSGKETEIWQVTGRVVLVRAEADGDLHIQLEDEDGSDEQIVVEVPLPDGQGDWCHIREIVFGWTGKPFKTFATSGSKQLKLTKFPLIKVTGPAFFDATHATSPDDNSREGEENVSVWEIHPIEKLVIVPEP
jgi:hypothetical protein